MVMRSRGLYCFLALNNSYLSRSSFPISEEDMLLLALLYFVLSMEGSHDKLSAELGEELGLVVWYSERTVFSYK